MKLLIANRGEIAARIAQSGRSLGIYCIGVFSPADAHAPHRWLCDEAWPLPQNNSYLDGQALLAQAKASGATAVHPGYGFLSQSPQFAQALIDAGLVWVGPSPRAMAEIGDKRAARLRAQRLGIPIIAGAEDVHTLADVRAQGERLGYPLLLKAAAAGGGRGLRLVNRADEVDAMWASAVREAEQAVGDGRLLVERWLQNVRHIEIQIMADGHQAAAIGTRECSLQRRYQKVVEEAPCDHIDAAILAQMGDAAQRLFADVGYSGAGTAEFLLDMRGDWFFLEVNPRLQVEHTVTEEVLGVDIVAWQLQVAMGKPLSALSAQTCTSRGHAIEVRLTAEDPHAEFLPSTGTVQLLQWPAGPGIRVDAGIAEGSEVSAHYDALLAKIIAWAPTREQARLRLLHALQQTVVLGVANNLAFLQSALQQKDFVDRTTFTTTLASWPWQPPVVPEAVLHAMHQQQPSSAFCGHGAAPGSAKPSPWQRHDNFGRT